MRHWHLVMLAFTFSLLTEAPPAGWVRHTEQDTMVGEKIRTTDRVAGDAAAGAGVALPVGANQPLLAELVARATTAGTRRASGARRALTPP